MRNRIIIDFHRGAYRLFCSTIRLARSGSCGTWRWGASARALMQLALNSVRK
jgi:hypothetical protein